MEGDSEHYGRITLCLGITFAFLSAFLDAFSYFMMRTIGNTVPGSILPFVSGIFTSTVVFIYSLIMEPFDIHLENTSPEYMKALGLALIGSIISYFS